MKCHYAVVRVGELPLLRECSLHSPRPVSTSDVSLLPCPILEPKAHLLFHDAYNCGTLSFLPFLAVWCISRGQCCVFCISQKPQSCSCYCWLLALCRHHCALHNSLAASAAPSRKRARGLLYNFSTVLPVHTTVILCRHDRHCVIYAPQLSVFSAQIW